MHKSKKGFTIMESVFALTLLTIGILGLGGAISQIIKSNSMVLKKQKAAFLAVSKLAELHSTPISKILELKGDFNKPFQDYYWQAYFSKNPEKRQTGDLWMEVGRMSGTGVKFWTQVIINDKL